MERDGSSALPASCITRAPFLFLPKFLLFDEKEKKYLGLLITHNKISMPNCPHVGESTVNISHVNIIII